jgi:hypothetical protein
MAAGPALAADERANDIQSFYVLWGMMDGAGNVCWEKADYDVRYMEELEGWKQRNISVRDEIDSIRVAAGLSESFASKSETDGSTGITDIFRAAVNAPEACAKWLADTANGGMDAEVYLAEQLGRLRERDGM